MCSSQKYLSNKLSDVYNEDRMKNLRSREVEVPTYPSRPTQLLVFHLLGLGFWMSRALEFMFYVKKAFGPSL
jgi:hypothetical protein